MSLGNPGKSHLQYVCYTNVTTETSVLCCRSFRFHATGVVAQFHTFFNSAHFCVVIFGFFRDLLMLSENGEWIFEYFSHIDLLQKQFAFIPQNIGLAQTYLKKSISQHFSNCSWNVN